MLAHNWRAQYRSLLQGGHGGSGSQMALLSLLIEDCFRGSGAKRPFCALRGRVWFPAPGSGGSHTVYIRPYA